MKIKKEKINEDISFIINDLHDSLKSIGDPEYSCSRIDDVIKSIGNKEKELKEGKYNIQYLCDECVGLKDNFENALDDFYTRDIESKMEEIRKINEELRQDNNEYHDILMGVIKSLRELEKGINNV